MGCDSFQFLNQDYAKILHKKITFFLEILRWFGENLYLYILSNCAFLLVYLNFGLYKNTRYFM